MNKKSLKNSDINIYFLLIFAFVQYPLRFTGYNYITYIFVYGIPIIYLIINYKLLLNLIIDTSNSFEKTSICIYIFLFIISCGWPIIRGTYEFSFVTEYWRRFFLLMVKNIFLLVLYEKKIANRKGVNVFGGTGNISNYVDYYLYSNVLYIVFTGILIIFKDIRSTLLEYLYLTPKEIVDVQKPEYLTRIGWGGWSGFDVTMHCAIGVALACIMILMYVNDLNKQKKYLILAGIMMIGNMFYGRTGLVTSLICIFISCIILILKKKIKLVTYIISSIIIAICAVLILKNFVPTIQSWYNWAFSAFINLFEQGKFMDNTGSIESLSEMYWMPNIKTFLLGDAFYNKDGLYYMETDSGIMRLMLFYGILNYILGLFAAGLIVSSFCKNIVKIFELSKKDFIIIFILLSVVIMLFEIKGETLYKVICVILPMNLLLDKETNKCD